MTARKWPRPVVVWSVIVLGLGAFWVLAGAGSMFAFSQLWKH